MIARPAHLLRHQPLALQIPRVLPLRLAVPLKQRGMLRRPEGLGVFLLCRGGGIDFSFRRRYAWPSSASCLVGAGTGSARFVTSVVLPSAAGDTSLLNAEISQFLLFPS